MTAGSVRTLSRSPWASARPRSDSSTTVDGSLMIFFTAGLPALVARAFLPDPGCADQEDSLAATALATTRALAQVSSGSPSSRPYDTSTFSPFPPASARCTHEMTHLFVAYWSLNWAAPFTLSLTSTLVGLAEALYWNGSSLIWYELATSPRSLPVLPVRNRQSRMESGDLTTAVPPRTEERVLSSTSAHGSWATRLPGVSSYFGGFLAIAPTTPAISLAPISHGLPEKSPPTTVLMPLSGSRAVIAVSVQPVCAWLSVTGRPLSCLPVFFGAENRWSLRLTPRFTRLFVDASPMVRLHDE